MLAITLLTSAKSSNANEIYIVQSGDDLTMTITQTGENHTITGLPVYDSPGIAGDGNTITINQDGGQYHWVEGEVVGDDNIIDSYQGGGGESNFAGAMINGNNNTLRVYQGKHEDGTTDTTEAGDHDSFSMMIGDNNNMEVYQTDDAPNCCQYSHFAGNLQYGDNNNTKTVQMDNGSHRLDTAAHGNNNSIEVRQEGSGSHFSEISVVGNDHTVNTQQKGTGAHSTTLDLTNGGGAYTVNTLQDSNNPQSYSLVGTCASNMGCSIVINQQ